MAKPDIGIQVENIVGLGIVTVERQFGIAGLDHVIKLVESLRQALIYEANKERTWVPK